MESSSSSELLLQSIQKKNNEEKGHRAKRRPTTKNEVNHKYYCTRSTVLDFMKNTIKEEL